MENANPLSPPIPPPTSELSCLEGELGFELLFEEVENKETIKELDDEVDEELKEEEEDDREYGLEVGLIRRIQWIGYNVLEFLGARIHRIFLDGYGVLVVRIVIFKISSFKLQNARLLLIFTKYSVITAFLKYKRLSNNIAGGSNQVLQDVEHEEEETGNDSNPATNDVNEEGEINAPHSALSPHSVHYTHTEPPLFTLRINKC
ncbi:hypothetical protein Tco_1476481 [Tanacetum coccineum]